MSFGWCVLGASGSCYGYAPGTYLWKSTRVTVISTGKKTKKITSRWDPKMGNPSWNVIRVESSVRSTGGVPGYDFSFTVCAKSGPYKGECDGPYSIGIIVN
jgi:hypothetical protein